MTATAPNILVVDDDPEIRKLLARYVEGQGFRVLLAASCRGPFGCGRALHALPLTRGYGTPPKPSPGIVTLCESLFHFVAGSCKLPIGSRYLPPATYVFRCF